MSFTFTDVFGLWVAAYTVIFMLLPIGLCIDWYKRGTSDGFSSLLFVLITTSVSFWLKYATMLEDKIQMTINGIALILFSSYLLVYCLMQTNKQNFFAQIVGCGSVAACAFAYVSSRSDTTEAKETMGGLASTFQIITFAGTIYEIYRVLFVLKTTEYLPFSMTLGGSIMAVQWYIFGALIGDAHIQRANLVAIIINGITLSLYFQYPPQTWTLPWQKKQKAQ